MPCTARCAVPQILASHINEEENNFWPQFKSLPGVDADLLCSLACKFEKAKGHAVTRCVCARACVRTCARSRARLGLNPY